MRAELQRSAGPRSTGHRDLLSEALAELGGTEAAAPGSPAPRAGGSKQEAGPGPRLPPRRDPSGPSPPPGNGRAPPGEAEPAAARPLPALRAGLHGGGCGGGGDCDEAGRRRAGAGGGAVGPGRVSSAAPDEPGKARECGGARRGERGGRRGRAGSGARAGPRRTKALCSLPPAPLRSAPGPSAVRRRAAGRSCPRLAAASRGWAGLGRARFWGRGQRAAPRPEGRLKVGPPRLGTARPDGASRARARLLEGGGSGRLSPGPARPRRARPTADRQPGGTWRSAGDGSEGGAAGGPQGRFCAAS